MVGGITIGERRMGAIVLGAEARGKQFGWKKKGMRVWSIEGGETARPDIALSKLTSHLTSAWEVKISLEVLSRTATVYLLPRFEKRKISGDFIVRRDGRSLVNFLLMHRTKNR